MSNIQVKNVPEPLHRRLRRQAKRRGCTMSELILRAVEAELARSEWRSRLANRPATDLGSSAADLLEAERGTRAGEL